MPLISPPRLFKINTKLLKKLPPNLQFFNGVSLVSPLSQSLISNQTLMPLILISGDNGSMMVFKC